MTDAVSGFEQIWAGLDRQDRDELWSIAANGDEPSLRLWQSIDALQPFAVVDVLQAAWTDAPDAAVTSRRHIRRDFLEWLNEKRSDPSFPT